MREGLDDDFKADAVDVPYSDACTDSSHIYILAEGLNKVKDTIRDGSGGMVHPVGMRLLMSNQINRQTITLCHEIRCKMIKISSLTT